VIRSYKLFLKKVQFLVYPEQNKVKYQSFLQKWNLAT